MPSLPAQQNCFVVEYVKDFNAVRAAERAGYSNPAYGNSLLESEDVQALISWYIGELRADAQVNAEWVLWEAVDNHRIARQQGNLSASNAALKLVGQLASVDAFAAQRVEHGLDDEVVERLSRGRERARLQSDSDAQTLEGQYSPTDGLSSEDVSEAEWTEALNPENQGAIDSDSESLYNQELRDTDSESKSLYNQEHSTCVHVYTPEPNFLDNQSLSSCGQNVEKFEKLQENQASEGPGTNLAPLRPGGMSQPCRSVEGEGDPTHTSEGPINPESQSQNSDVAEHHRGPKSGKPIFMQPRTRDDVTFM